MNMWVMIGSLAVVFTAAQMLPQVIKTFKTKEVSQLSWGMLMCVVLGSTLWLMYGIHYRIKDLVIANALNLLAGLTLMTLKCLYRTRN